MLPVTLDFLNNPSDKSIKPIAYGIDHPKAKNTTVPTHQKCIIKQKNNPHINCIAFGQAETHTKTNLGFAKHLP